VRSIRILVSWWIAFINVVHYFLFKLRILKQPRFRNYPTHWEPWLGSFLGWPKSLRVRGAEHCADPPVIFAANHAKLDDPLFIWGGVHYASDGKNHIHFMMRDDFFVGWPWDYLPFSLNELTDSAGAIQISRDNVQLSQLKPFLKVLGDPGSFVMFPGRTRSRSGLVVDYMDGVEEPGGVSFFAVHAQRRNKDRQVAVVPTMRTFNPATKLSTVAFGPPLYLDTKASREEQRAFDLEVMTRVGDLVELHGTHVVSGLLYLQALHGGSDTVGLDALINAVGEVLKKLSPDRGVDPHLLDEQETAVQDALQYLAKREAVLLSGGGVTLNRDTILFAPERDTRYRKDNPVKFFLNQVIHLRDVVNALEESAVRLRKGMFA
jgi:1-acyl-sn-glycerol-3-phosphate acyltransferase